MRRWRVVLVLVLGALCGGCAEDDEAPLREAVGTWRLDRRDYAERLLAIRVRESRRRAADALDDEARAKVEAECRELAATLHLTLALGEDGTYVVRLRSGAEESRYAGSWTRAGNQLTFQTTRSPTGVVTSLPDVQAVLTPEGLLFSGWLVPHDFLLRLEPR